MRAVKPAGRAPFDGGMEPSSQPQPPDASESILSMVQGVAEGLREGLRGAFAQIGALERDVRTLAGRLSAVEAHEDARALRAGERPVRVALLAQLAPCWVVWESVYAAMRDDPRFDVRVVALPFARAASADEGMASFLNRAGVPFVDHRFYDPGVERPDVALVQSPYDHTRPAAFQSAALRAAGVRVVYTSYGLELSGGGAYDQGNFRQDFICRAWRIFARSETHRRMYGARCPRGNDHVRVTGHPKLDGLLAGPADRAALEAIRARADGRKIVLYNPQWSVSADGAGPSTFLRYGEALVRLVEARDDVLLVLRPHPLLFGTLVQVGLRSADEIAALRARLVAAPAVWLDESGDYRAAMHAADALVSDLSSLLLEFAVLDKPVAYLESPTGPELNDDGAVLDAFARPTDETSLEAFLDEVVRGEDPRAARRRAAVDAAVYRPEGGVAPKVLEEIAQGLGARPPAPR